MSTAISTSAPKVLTITKATAEAGRIARRIMPGVLVTVNSRGSWDMATDTHIIITTVTFPAGRSDATNLYLELSTLSNRHGNMQFTAESVTITRRVR